jgi:hypothetical protein
LVSYCFIFANVFVVVVDDDGDDDDDDVAP